MNTNLRRFFFFLLAVLTIAGTVSSACASIRAQAEAAAEFHIHATEQSGNEVVVAVDLTSGTFNAIDFRFNMSAGVTCNSLSAQGNLMGVGNPSNGSLSAVTTSTVPCGTVFIGTFTVPEAGSYSITGSVSNCTVCSTDSGANITIAAAVSGSVSGYSEPSGPSVKAPMLEIVKTSQDGNDITVDVNLTGNRFNSMDFRFAVSDGVVCKSITSGGNLTYESNTDECRISLKTSDMFIDTETIIRAEFTVPENKAYSIAGSASNCVIAVAEYNYIVPAIIKGRIQSGGAEPSVPESGTEISVYYKETAQVTHSEIPYGGSVEYKSLNPSVAAVDSNGKITTVSRGTAVILCNISDADGKTTTEKCTVTVNYRWWQWIIRILLLGFLWY